MANVRHPLTKKIIKSHKWFVIQDNLCNCIQWPYILKSFEFPPCGTLYAMENRSQMTHQEQGVVEPTRELRTLESTLNSLNPFSNQVSLMPNKVVQYTSIPTPPII